MSCDHSETQATYLPTTSIDSIATFHLSTATLGSMTSGASILTVQIRSPALNETLCLKISSDASVQLLKKHIQDVHPQKPMASDQRIIHSGKLLCDGDYLKDVLAKTDTSTVPTFHLVVKPSLSSSAVAIAAAMPKSTEKKEVPAIPLETNHCPGTSSSYAPIHYPNTLQSRTNPAPSNLTAMAPGGYQVVIINGQYYLAPVLVSSAPFTPSLGYPLTQPYLSQAHENTSYPTHTYPQPQFYSPAHSADQHTSIPHTHLPPVAAPAPAAPIAAVHPIHPAPAPAPAVPAQAEDQRVFFRQRIILQNSTSIWLAVKLIVVLFIVCQGAEIERVIFFHLLALCFFLYQTGRLRFVIRRVRRQDPGMNRQGIPAQPRQYNEREAPGAAAVGPEANVNVTISEEPLTLTSIVKRAFYLFILSLWPDYGHPPNIAQEFENAM